jgi:hypothetical protein
MSHVSGHYQVAHVQRTLLNKFSLGDPPPNLILVALSSFRNKGLVQPRAEVIEAKGIFSAQVQKLYHTSVRSSDIRR